MFIGSLMKHADIHALERLGSLLDEIRKMAPLKERSQGVFYFKSKAFLHFHDDPSGLFADLRTGSDFERFPVNSAEQRSLLLQTVRAHLR